MKGQLWFGFLNPRQSVLYFWDEVRSNCVQKNYLLMVIAFLLINMRLWHKPSSLKMNSDIFLPFNQLAMNSEAI